MTELADWSMCPGCRGLIYGKRLARNLQVCPECNRHGPLTAPQRLGQLLDPGSAQLLDLPVPDADPLGFADTRPYPERLRQARERTGLTEAVLCARGTIEGHAVVAAVMDFRFMGGSLGSAVGELITRAAELALADRVPLLIVTASGGARMQEGALSLMQMAKTSAVLGQLDEAGILTISLVTDPTYGGVAASFATLCDVIVAEPGARLGFAGRRVIEQTIRESLPPGFQTAEFLLERGLVDMVRPRSALRATLARLIAVKAGRRRPPVALRLVASGTPEPAGSEPVGPEPAAPGQPAGPGGEAGSARPGRRPFTLASSGTRVGEPLVWDPDELPAGDPWDAVRRARDLRRPTTVDYVGRIVDDFEELRGDRLGGDCPAVVGGVGWLGRWPVVVIGHQKGHDVRELAARNYGMPAPSGYRKAARLMRLAAKLGVPVVTLVDTPGAYPGRTAEEQGQAVAIAENLRLMAGLPVPVVAVVTGEGGSGGALALAVADRVLMCANAVYSVISPEGCAAILWNDPAAAPQAAAALRLQAGELLRLGVVDGVVPEPVGGAQEDHAEAAERLAAALTAALGELVHHEPAVLVRARRARFRGFGMDSVGPAGAGRDREGLR